MHPLVSAALYFGVGIVVGFVIGRLTRREVEHDVIGEVAVERGWWKKSSVPARVLGVVVVVLTIMSAFLVSQAVRATNDLAEQTDVRAACVTDVLTDLTESLNEAASLTAQVSTAARLNAQAQAAESQATVAVLTAALNPPEGGELPEDEATALVQTWLDATEAAQAAAQEYVDLSQRLADVRREHPVPDVAEIEACR